jgi:propionyl-CoA carboxylase alpha chain
VFSKILIANRGEIACRVMQTCKRLGVKTVAVYSEADEGALHMGMADEAVPIGPPPPNQSYIDIERIVRAAKETGADAVHPGYGFLAENPKFADALSDAGIDFIGPPMAAVRAMGDKIESKKLARRAKVAVVPGHLGVVSDPEEALEVARGVGYPVMLKASAGGGGKGMRVAMNDAELAQSFRSAGNEALQAFGDGRIFIEKFIENPRHIEIQILGDQHGNIVHLGERECSIQRRHQKVIEEAPSPFLDEATRQAMGEQAVRLAKSAGYYSVGTVEFMVDAKRKFYFLEMNTRLQVEHPVTELVTGIDLVEQMIRIAAGEKLDFGQSDIRTKGWAIEARIYAEDPARGFLPSIGRLRAWRPPAGEGLRVDTGVAEGSEITRFYDPLIAKLCAWAETRQGAIERLRSGLDETLIGGVGNNLNFLAAVAAHPRFRQGRLNTNFINEEWPEGFRGGVLDRDAQAMVIAVAAFAHVRTLEREAAITGAAASRRVPSSGDWSVALNGEIVRVSIEEVEKGLIVALGPRKLTVESAWRPGQPLFRGLVDGRPVGARIARLADGILLGHGGIELKIAVRRPELAKLARHMPARAAADLSKFLLSPMPGLIVSVNVAAGEPVKAGQTLAVVEAMKMENVLKAEQDGVISRISAKAGDSVAVDQVILEFE